MVRAIFSFLIRAAITAVALFFIFRSVDLASLQGALRTIQWGKLFVAVGSYFLAQCACIARWRLLVPRHPALTWGYLTRSFFIGSFFNTFLPTTVGGDVVRGYDMIKATGEWRGSLASLLMDRLIGLLGLVVMAFVAWLLFPPAREDWVLTRSFLGLCLVVLGAFVILGSRRILHAFLRPFGKIGLGTLQAHAKQFQESLLSYRKRPRKLMGAFCLTFFVQLFAILSFVGISQALQMNVPVLFFILIVPIVFLVSQLPISLSGWGVREGAVILLFERIGVGAVPALSLSLLSGAIPLLGGAIGGILFLVKGKRRQR